MGFCGVEKYSFVTSRNSRFKDSTARPKVIARSTNTQKTEKVCGKGSFLINERHSIGRSWRRARSSKTRPSHLLPRRGAVRLCHSVCPAALCGLPSVCPPLSVRSQVCPWLLLTRSFWHRLADDWRTYRGHWCPVNIRRTTAYGRHCRHRCQSIAVGCQPPGSQPLPVQRGLAAARRARLTTAQAYHSLVSCGSMPQLRLYSFQRRRWWWWWRRRRRRWW